MLCGWGPTVGADGLAANLGLCTAGLETEKICQSIAGLGLCQNFPAFGGRQGWGAGEGLRRGMSAVGRTSARLVCNIAGLEPEVRRKKRKLGWRRTFGGRAAGPAATPGYHESAQADALVLEPTQAQQYIERRRRDGRGARTTDSRIPWLPHTLQEDI